MTDKASPLPWKCERKIVVCGDEEVFDAETSANAALIVRCVNAMPAMIEALEKAIRAIEGEGMYLDTEFAAALDAAKGVEHQKGS